jgi:hypothetical protein
MVFQSLNHARQFTANGFPIAISHQEVLAWSTLHNETLSKSELMLLRQIDAVWINARNELQREITNG